LVCCWLHRGPHDAAAPGLPSIPYTEVELSSVRGHRLTAIAISPGLRLGFSLVLRGTRGERIPRTITSRFEPMNRMGGGFPLSSRRRREEGRGEEGLGLLGRPSLRLSPHLFLAGERRCEIVPLRFMGSLDLPIGTPIGAMNLLASPSFAPPRSVPVMHSDAPARVARWGDWFWPVTRLLIGETDSVWPSPWKDLSFSDSWPGTARGTRLQVTL